MARLVSVFISARHRRALNALVWSLAFVAVLVVIGTYATQTAKETLAFEARESASHFVRLRGSLLSTFDAMHAQATAAPCTPAFNEQLRQIAYLPDGLNEFMYAPGGIIQCSVNIPQFEAPYDLGTPDVPWQAPAGFAFWLDRDLHFLQLAGLEGTVVLQEPFATIVPPQKVDLTAPDWMALEVAFVANDGSWWHRNGVEGVYERARAASQASGPFPFRGGALHHLECDPHGVHCIAAEAGLAGLVAREWGTLALALAAAALLATGVMAQFRVLVERYWSFEQRFRRNLTPDSIVCAYQPVMNLDSGEIAGCEVLARWRDLDERVVAPDRLVGVVARHGLTLSFTEMVARRAFDELSRQLPVERRIQVSFNIFPCDLSSVELLRVYAPFLRQPERFDVVLEIVESDAIPANAQAEIEALRRAGIRTYIDDFGTGYSNMQNLAALSVDGVKLDRSFAMAPENSMMAQMLSHAVEMIHATGRAMVVEGVETPERLEILRAMTTRIDFVQGYLISRPLDIAGFAAFLKEYAGGQAPARHVHRGQIRL